MIIKKRSVFISFYGRDSKNRRYRHIDNLLYIKVYLYLPSGYLT